MLKKLLKYDFKSIFKFWWIAAVTALALSVIGGFSIQVLRAERDLPQVVDVSAGMMLFISIFSLFAFAVLTTILIFIRYYKNFFTDEGYLTFTLPVKTGSLINSKLLVSVLTSAATFVMLMINAGFIVGIGFFEEIFNKEFFQYALEIIKDIFDTFGGYVFVYALEGLIMVLLSFLFSYLFLFSCITLASVITQKARIITAIGIYYGVNCVISFVMQLFVIFGVTDIMEKIGNLGEKLWPPVLALAIFAVIIFMALSCVLLYTLQYWMLDRKLNLS